jgi:GNAT superfamily N-acetyltransferase
MGQRIDDRELRRRALAGICDEVEAFGSAAPDSSLVRREGLLAAVAPATPQRSLFNSVYYSDPAVLAGEVEGLEGTYDRSGVRAWTVWVPDEDRETAEMLAARGHKLDASPRAMALDLSDLAPEPPAPAGIEPRPGDAPTAAELNDRAYGYGNDGFRAGLSGETVIRWHAAYDGEEAIGCVGTIEVGDDCCVTGVATPPEYRGRGVASWLLWRALEEAREQSLRSASLQASRAGAPLYERLGFADLGFVEMWELRR